MIVREECCCLAFAIVPPKHPMPVDTEEPNGYSHGKEQLDGKNHGSRRFQKK